MKKKFESKIIPETNRNYTNGESYTTYDRIYGGLHKSDQKLIQKDGTTYKGRIDKRSIKLNDGTLGIVYCTADNRWFDRCGMPIGKPKNLITRKVNDE